MRRRGRRYNGRFMEKIDGLKDEEGECRGRGRGKGRRG